ncbi:hypothetical protein JYK14_02950 [Siccirubricoccus sp. KC 17139]|uniref:Ribbon-helix-helix protein, CopG family n=1 Tax=Siccirubricoccus soli TaxID=2899147 RepID=A0ABT1D1E3_9PROT|nr:hypothetical protein [Siccirubricoccus soli]MCO6415135.1 hypothetical protein [Siccirubricoccus soli]MCP2681266.1 hypothetical protein [Siccirubricoccus soli]
MPAAELVSTTVKLPAEDLRLLRVAAARRAISEGAAVSVSALLRDIVARSRSELEIAGND